jgi:hypothetical protein
LDSVKSRTSTNETQQLIVMEVSKVEVGRDVATATTLNLTVATILRFSKLDLIKPYYRYRNKWPHNAFSASQLKMRLANSRNAPHEIHIVLLFFCVLNDHIEIVPKHILRLVILKSNDHFGTPTPEKADLRRGCLE